MSEPLAFRFVFGLLLSMSIAVAFVSMGAAGTLSTRVERPNIGPRPAPPPPDLAEHEHHRQGSTIGADTPNQIPDDVAIGLLFRTLAHLAQQSGVSGDSLQRFLLHIERSSDVQFSEQERLAIVSEAEQYAEQTRITSSAQASSFRSLRTLAAIDRWDALQSSVSPAVSKALRRFLDVNVKRNIKILK